MARNRSEHSKIIELTSCEDTNRFITLWYLSHHGPGDFDYDCFEDLRERLNGLKSSKALAVIRSPKECHLSGWHLKRLCVSYIDKFDLSVRDMEGIVYQWRSELQWPRGQIASTA